MLFVRTWLRGLLGAWGATLLVPVGLVLAVAVAATVGGTGLGEIGQVFRGPALPSGQVVAQRVPGELGGGEGTTSTVPSIPTAPPSHSTRGNRGSGTSGGSRRAAQAPASSVPGQRPSRLPSVKPKRRRPSGSSTTTPTPPSNPPPKPPAEGPVRRVGGTVQHSVEPVPVVGPPAADAVGTVVDLISPPKTAPAPAPVATPAPPPAG
jgi:hypothetical protein